MVFTPKRRQSNRRLSCQLNDVDQDIVIGNIASDRKENTIVNEGTVDRHFTVDTSGNNSMTSEIKVNVKSLERCFNEKIEMSNFVDTAKDRIQNAISTAIDSTVVPKIELAIRSKNMSSGRDATSVTANSELGEHIRVTSPFENASENNNALHISD